MKYWLCDGVLDHSELVDDEDVADESDEEGEVGIVPGPEVRPAAEQ